MRTSTIIGPSCVLSTFLLGCSGQHQTGSIKSAAEFSETPPVVQAATESSVVASTLPAVALPESKAGQGIGTPPSVPRDMPKMPPAKPGAAEAVPVQTTAVPPPADFGPTAHPVETQPAMGPGVVLTEGKLSFTLSRKDKAFPKRTETVDEICVYLKKTRCNACQAYTADLEVQVTHDVKRYRELRPGSHISGRGYSHRPYQITIVNIDPCTETVTFLMEPLNRLPIR